MQAAGLHPTDGIVAREITVTGRVQGVGYRPFVYRVAHEFNLKGTVLNGSGKVFIHAEGLEQDLDRLEEALTESAPPLAQPVVASSHTASMTGASVFEIRASEASAEAEIHVPPDLFTCADCTAEMTGPAERRFAYPFINCTQCGPRYTIITDMPYDRPNTSLRDFPLCEDCRREYEDPMDRRFHAQPLACPVCGPRLAITHGCESERGESATTTPLEQAVAALQSGKIVAVKGVGGYHLMCDAADDEAVSELRRRKLRPHKPLAVMFPIRGEDGLDAVRESLTLDIAEAGEISDPSRPIVLVRRREDCPLSRHLAPGLRELGVFLPYSPLHHLLLTAFGSPLVATSGNISGEPVITSESDAANRLSGIADVHLSHNRPIVRPADDSVVRVIAGRARPIRVGRGIAPLEHGLPFRLENPILATGAHMKNTVALAWEDRIVVSPHIGELDSPRSQKIFGQVIDDLQALYGVTAEHITCDLHPGYASSRWAHEQTFPVTPVQHHAAHASALAGEHPDISQWLVFAWDGVGTGPDGTLWGGEALCGGPGHWRRRSSFRPFTLSGGDRAGREPWRSAAALMWEIDGDWLPCLEDGGEGVMLAKKAWLKGINSFETSAAGRLFDAAACLILSRTQASFEGQGPMELEQLASGLEDAVGLPLAKDANGIWRSDWAPLLPVLTDESIAAGERASIFHTTMARALVDQAVTIHREFPFEAIGLSGGVFQNRLLTEVVINMLGESGLDVRLHEKIPANDGGLSFGQVIEAHALMSLKSGG